MSFTPYRIIVRGQAALLTAPAMVAEQWKQLIAEAVAAHCPSGVITEPCAVHLEFDRQRTTGSPPALVNLLKATIDGLSRPLFSPAKKGPATERNREDWRITHLAAAQRVVERLPEVRILVAPAPGGVASEPRGAVLAETFVPGRPPLWPGDAAGQRMDIAWRESLTRMLGPLNVPPDESAFGVGLSLFVARRLWEETDLDNLCVPAGQAICFAVYGNLANPHRIVELVASKALASTQQSVGVRVCITRLDSA